VLFRFAAFFVAYAVKKAFDRKGRKGFAKIAKNRCFKQLSGASIPLLRLGLTSQVRLCQHVQSSSARPKLTRTVTRNPELGAYGLEPLAHLIDTGKLEAGL
jgi:hypothetical protein